jgi:hypothetical protein
MLAPLPFALAHPDAILFFCEFRGNEFFNSHAMFQTVIGQANRHRGNYSWPPREFRLALHRTGLREEMEAIHFANRLYWNLTDRSHEADMEQPAETGTAEPSSERI